jgi:hypothetical protein
MSITGDALLETIVVDHAQEMGLEYVKQHAGRLRPQAEYIASL